MLDKRFVYVMQNAVAQRQYALTGDARAPFDNALAVDLVNFTDEQLLQVQLYMEYSLARAAESGLDSAAMDQPVRFEWRRLNNPQE